MELFLYILLNITISSKHSDKPDPATGLTKKQVSLIKSSWQLVAKNQKDNGVKFFMKLFKDYPYTQDYFELFKGRSIESLKDDAKMRAHATLVMYCISSLVDNLEDAETLVSIVEAVGRNHFDKNISTKSFVDLQKTFGPFLKEQLKVSDETVKAWVHIFGVVNSLIFKLAKERGYTN